MDTDSPSKGGRPADTASKQEGSPGSDETWKGIVAVFALMLLDAELQLKARGH